jgi:Lipopolysaccharide export system permease LptF/LptG
MRGSLDRLRALAARILDRRTMERVIDPLLADLHTEYEEANRRGYARKRRWILLAGHLVFLKTVALSEVELAMTLLRDDSADDITALKRTLTVSIVAIALTTFVLEMPPLLNFPFAVSTPKTILYLLPQALVLAVPMGFTVGVFFGLRGRVVSLRSRVAVLAGATILSFASLAMLFWILPSANQQFRQVVFGHVSGNDGAIVMKGVNELTLSELSERIGAYRRTGAVPRNGHVLDSDPRELSYSYHQRWALSCATVILAMFALSMTQRLVGGWVVGLGALSTILIYYVLLWSGRAGVLQHGVPAFVGAWMPNALFALVCVVVMAAPLRRVPPPGASAPTPGLQ